MLRLLAGSLVVIGLGGCVPSLMVATQRDTAYQLDKRLPLYVELGDDIGIPEKNTYNLLQSALQRSGFSVVSSASDAKLILTFKIMDVESYYRTYGYDPFDFYWYRRYPYRYGWYDYPRFDYPRTYVVENKAVKLRLFEAARYLEGKRIPLWEGVVAGDPSTVEKRIQESLDFLVNKIGEDYRGRLRLQ